MLTCAPSATIVEAPLTHPGNEPGALRGNEHPLAGAGCVAARPSAAIDVGTALLAIVPLCFVFIPQPQAVKETSETTEGKPSMLDDLREGLRFIWGWPGLVMIIAISALVYMLMVPVYSLLPILVTEHLRGSALQLAWLNIATTVGTIVLSFRSRTRQVLETKPLRTMHMAMPHS